jgi:hypothetical protein
VAKNEKLEHQFSQVKGDLNLQKMPKPIFIPKKSTKAKDNYDVLCMHPSIVFSKNFFKNKKKKKEQNLIHCV